MAPGTPLWTASIGLLDAAYRPAGHSACHFTCDNGSSANPVKDERFSLNGQIKRTLLGLLARFHTENRLFVGAACTVSLKVRKNHCRA